MREDDPAMEPSRSHGDEDRSSVREKVLCRFQAFIDHKSRAAAAMQLPPYTTELERPIDRVTDTGERDAEPFLLRSQSGGRLLSFRDVASRFGYADDGAGCVADRRDG